MKVVEKKVNYVGPEESGSNKKKNYLKKEDQPRR